LRRWYAVGTAVELPVATSFNLLMKRSFKQLKLVLLWRRFQLLARKLHNGSLSEFANTSFSQEGEDLVILRQITHLTTGFYIEVGALAPKRFSNTWMFYTLGWNGILIEPNPSVKSDFGSQRPRDIFVNEGVSSKEQSLLYYQFDEPALNTFDSSIAEVRRAEGWRQKGEVLIKTRPLKDILEEYLPSGTKIDILSIDVEGLDEIVIKSNDWQKFRPEWLIIEMLDTDLTEVAAHPLAIFLAEQNYQPTAKTGHSVIFHEVTEVI
jgi:Methyltransferase FkbM domain